MSDSYLEVTYRHGRPVAAYYYLPRKSGDKSHGTKRIDPGLIIDLSRNGRPIGIEITAPGKVTLTGLNRVFAKLGLQRVSRDELAPLLAA